MNLYYENLKDLKGLYKFIRFKKIFWIFKNTFKIIRINGKKITKNDEVWMRCNNKHFNLLIAILILASCFHILTFPAIAFPHFHFWNWTIDLEVYVDFLIIIIILWYI